MMHDLVRSPRRRAFGPRAPSTEAPVPVLSSLLVVALVALTLRIPLASIPPLAPGLAADLGMSSTSVAILTALPLVAFGAFAVLAPRLAAAHGADRALGWALAGVAAGVVMRTAGDVAWLFAGTALAGAGVAFVNVLLPGIVRRDFAGRAGLATGLYTMSLSVGASAAAAVTVPVSRLSVMGWRFALGVWVLPVLVALVAWRRRGRASAGQPVAVVDARATGRVARAPIAWALLLFLGLQSLVFFTVLAWLPAILQSRGYGPEDAGLILSLTQVVGIPASFLLPQLAFRSRHQMPHALAPVGATAVGLVGLALLPGVTPVVWALLIGLGAAAFPVGLMLVVLRSSSTQQTDSLSAFVQAGGYLLAALGPVIAGAIHDATRDWNAAILSLLVFVVPQAVAGTVAARDRLVL